MNGKVDWYGKVSVGIMKAICIPHEGASAPSFFNKLREEMILDIIIEKEPTPTVAVFGKTNSSVTMELLLCTMKWEIQPPIRTKPYSGATAET